METSVIDNELTDGSTVFDLVFVDGSARATIHCISESDAYALQSALKKHALDAVIDPR